MSPFRGSGTKRPPRPPPTAPSPLPYSWDGACQAALSDSADNLPSGAFFYVIRFGVDGLPHGPSMLRHAGLRARCRPARVLARRDPKWPRAPPAFGTVGCWVHVDRLLTPDSSKSTVAPSVSARLVGFGTSTACRRRRKDVKTGVLGLRFLTQNGPRGRA